MIDFKQIWSLLYEHGASAKKEEGTRRFWDTLTPFQQEQVFTTISTKLRDDKFVQYDPIRALKENIRRQPGPEFLRGDELNAEVQVKYNGMFKICSRATMELYGLEYVRDWN